MTPAPEDEGIFGRVIGWLRAGYPDGVPAQDYVALFGILRRTLTPYEMERVVEQLGDDAVRALSAGDALDAVDVRQRIEEVLVGPALPEDIARVAGRLAQAGWPLGVPEETASDTSADRVGLVGRVVRWLRAGYPAGLPENDFVPLVALLRRRLTDAEVTAVADRLAGEGALPTTRVDVGAAILAVTSELPSEEDVERVRTYLADNGWPVDFPV